MSFRFRRNTGLCGSMVLLFLFSCAKEKREFMGFRKPAHFPEPVYNFSQNAVTYDGFLLGRKLFYDGRLSRDGSISCGSCHIQYSAFTQHGHPVSHGIDDKLGVRNSPPVQNLAWADVFFWDGGVHDLDLLPFVPIENPVEMDETVANVLQKLRNDEAYPKLFQKAFGSKEIDGMRMMRALSQFMVMLVSADTPYDRYIRGDENALSAGQKQGLAIFRQKCAGCHVEPLFTDHSFRNNGLFQGADKGRYQVTANEADLYRFKVPSLRNLSYTKPYMHHGETHSLYQVLQHYSTGIVESPTLDPLLQGGIQLTDDDKANLILFLQALDDENFVKNPLFAEP